MISLKEIQNDADHGDYVFTLIVHNTQSSQKEEETIQVRRSHKLVDNFLRNNDATIATTPTTTTMPPSSSLTVDELFTLFSGVLEASTSSSDFGNNEENKKRKISAVDLLTFLDDSPPSPLLLFKSLSVQRRVDSMETTVKKMYNRLEGLEAQFNEVYRLVKKLVEEEVSDVSGVVEALVEPLASSISTEDNFCVLDRTTGQTVDEVTPDDTPLSGAAGAIELGEGGNEKAKVQIPPATTFALCEPLAHSSDEDEEDVISRTSDLSNSIHCGNNVAEGGDQYIVSAPCAALSFAQEEAHQAGKQLANNLMKCLPLVNFYDGDILSLEKEYSLTKEDTDYYQYLVNFLRKQVRLSINCSLVETGLHEIGCALRGVDQIDLSVLLSRHHYPSWYSTLCESLGSFLTGEDDANRGDDANASSLASPLPPDSVDSARGNVAAGNGKILIKGLRCTKLSEENSQVTFTVNDVSISMQANRHMNLCFMAFLDEVNVLVGQDNLFKRSLLLIRAWWTAGASTYTGRSMGHYLTTEAQALMVCTIFNLHHQKIQSPLQALVILLVEWLNFDPNQEVWTLQGRQPAGNRPHSSSSTTLTSSVTSFSLGKSPLAASSINSGSEQYLIGQDTLEKYWRLYHLTDPNQNMSGGGGNQMGGATQIHPSYHPAMTNMNHNVNASNNPQIFVSQLDGYYNNNSSNNNSIGNNRLTSNALNDAAQPLEGVNSYPRSGLTIIHPFTGEPIVRAVLKNRLVSTKQMRTIDLAVKETATMLLDLLINVYNRQQRSVPMNQMSLFDHPLFSGMMTYFRENSKKMSVINQQQELHTQLSMENDLLLSCRSIYHYTSSDRIWQNILFVNFILFSIISESAILTATIESLAFKGPLPVGEVGKILTDISSMPQLSLHLKEKFGGLKKFLEKFPEVFIFSNDHPFNPHVLLRKCLGPEYQKMIYRGVIPMQIMTLFKKNTGGKRGNKGSNPHGTTPPPGNTPAAGIASMNLGTAFAPSHGPPSGAASISTWTGESQPSTFSGMNLDKVQPFVPSYGSSNNSITSGGVSAASNAYSSYPSHSTSLSSPTPMLDNNSAHPYAGVPNANNNNSFYHGQNNSSRYSLVQSYYRPKPAVPPSYTSSMVGNDRGLNARPGSSNSASRGFNFGSNPGLNQGYGQPSSASSLSGLIGNSGNTGGGFNSLDMPYSGSSRSSQPSHGYDDANRSFAGNMHSSNSYGGRDYSGSEHGDILGGNKSFGYPGGSSGYGNGSTAYPGLGLGSSLGESSNFFHESGNNISHGSTISLTGGSAGNNGIGSNGNMQYYFPTKDETGLPMIGMRRG